MTIVTDESFINDEGQLVTVIRNNAGDIIGWNITTTQPIEDVNA